MQATELNDMFQNIRGVVYKLIQEKNVDVDELAFSLGIGREAFIRNFSARIDDFTFYLQTLSLLEHWEG